MNDQTNWEARLLQIARESPDMPGPTGDKLRECIRQRAAHDFAHDLELAHARARYAVVTGVRMSIRCCALLLKAKRTMPADDFTALLRVACMTPAAAEQYMQFALESPRLREICARRNGRIDEADALHVLRGQRAESFERTQTDSQANPLPDLRALLQINDQ